MGRPWRLSLCKISVDERIRFGATLLFVFKDGLTRNVRWFQPPLMRYLLDSDVCCSMLWLMQHVILSI